MSVVYSQEAKKRENKKKNKNILVKLGFNGYVDESSIFND